jgi:D-alanyl-D-alanine dipeptidase
MPLRPWSPIPIRDNGEPLQELPPALLRLEPHPYASLGAPYGACSGPFRLRRGVIERLLQAQASLRQERGDWRLAIFDAWRPLAVQRFMVRHAFVQECRRRGLHPDLTGAGQREVEELVGRFWAPPSVDPATPPPHSTGGAVDLTLADREGRPLADLRAPPPRRRCRRTTRLPGGAMARPPPPAGPLPGGGRIRPASQ